MSQVVISQKVSCYNAKPSSYSKISFIENYGGYFWVQERKQKRKENRREERALILLVSSSHFSHGRFYWQKYLVSIRQIIKVLPGNLPHVNECATMPSINNVTKSS